MTRNVGYLVTCGLKRMADLSMFTSATPRAAVTEAIIDSYLSETPEPQRGAEKAWAADAPEVSTATDWICRLLADGFILYQDMTVEIVDASTAHVTLSKP